LARRKVDRVTKGRYVLVHRPKSAHIGRTLLGIVANRVECRIKCYFLSCGRGKRCGTSPYETIEKQPRGLVSPRCCSFQLSAEYQQSQHRLRWILFFPNNSVEIS
jgi:hypothetical protein